MKKRILTYIEKTRFILDSREKDRDWEKILSEHLIQIGFFQHERLVHLIVTVTFGLVFVMLSGLLLLVQQFYTFMGIFFLFIIVGVTLVFYVLHYFLLENKVQQLYGIYDEILKQKNDHEEGKFIE